MPVKLIGVNTLLLISFLKLQEAHIIQIIFIGAIKKAKFNGPFMQLMLIMSLLEEYLDLMGMFT